ncbi:uncharacterized protein LOC112686513 [Sipha flava]|uniref:Uncharacterized protein LOC112686513 n=1 Tax=Sipha flava TaxID=143950 RepID=A0A8B8FW55_9HEMI|nr:uncharacterized protein LOC112686513 [Sipha flava]
MDFGTMSCEESAAAKSLMRNMANYCMNAMRKRTIDEQLGDLSAIMGCPLDLKIVYNRTALQVSYCVGSLSASVTGADESTCVRRCKRDLLHKLKVFCAYTNDGARTSSSDWQARSDNSPESSSETKDVYSEVELSKERVTGKTARKAFDQNIVLVDPEMDISSEMCEFMDINESPLVLTVSYLPAEWNMILECGLYSASINGSVKSTCMRQSKMLLLHELNAFVTDENIVNREAVNSDDTPLTVIANEDDNTQEDKLRKLSDCEKPLGNVSNESVSTVRPREVSDESVVSVKESDRKTFNSYDESGNDRIKVHEVFGSVYNRKNEIARNGSISSENQRWDPPSRNNINVPAVEPVIQPQEITNSTPVSTELPVTRSNDQSRISSNILEPYKLRKYVSRASEVLKNVTCDTFQENAIRFFDILVQTNRADRLHLKMITDCLVSNAIDKPDNCALYASLCCHAIKKAFADSRRTVSQGLSNAFKIELIQSCRNVLTEGGVLSRVGTSRQSQDPERSEQMFDIKVRDRTQGTCRLMGELFMQGQMFKTVMNTIDTFMQIHDAHSLECLCVLLIIIGPKLEKIIDAPRLVYEQLKSYSIAGYAGDIPLTPQTVQMIDIVLNVRMSYMNGSNSRRGDFAEGKTRKPGNRHRRDVQSKDRRANHISGEISQYSRNPPSCTTATSAQRHRKHVTFNPVTSIFFYRNH